jgi:hypothetical protein
MRKKNQSDDSTVFEFYMFNNDFGRGVGSSLNDNSYGRKLVQHNRHERKLGQHKRHERKLGRHKRHERTLEK